NEIILNQVWPVANPAEQRRMEVARGKRHRHAGFVGGDRGVFGVSRTDVSLPGAGGSGRRRSVHGLPRERNGGNGSRHRGSADVVCFTSVDYGVARAADLDCRAVAPHAGRCSSFMPTVAAGPEIERLISLLARLPGLGPRSARRAALFLIKKRDQLMAPLAAALQTALEKIEVCRICGNIDTLVSRAHDPAVTEVILALNATVDGQTTAHYITDLLHDANVKVTRLAHGVPVGGELDYLDEGTLAAAIRQRTKF